MNPGWKLVKAYEIPYAFVLFPQQSWKLWGVRHGRDHKYGDFAWFLSFPTSVKFGRVVHRLSWNLPKTTEAIQSECRENSLCRRDPGTSRKGEGVADSREGEKIQMFPPWLSQIDFYSYELNSCDGNTWEMKWPSIKCSSSKEGNSCGQKHSMCDGRKERGLKPTNQPIHPPNVGSGCSCSYLCVYDIL